MTYTEEERAEIRRSIRVAVGEAAMVEAVYDSLPHLTRNAITREIKYLCSRNALAMTGNVRGKVFVIRL